MRSDRIIILPEPTAACVQGYGGMLEVDLGDPVCPLPA